MRFHNVSIIVLGATAMLAITAAQGSAQVDSTRMRDTTGMRARTGRDRSMREMKQDTTRRHLRTAGRRLRSGTDTSQTRIPVTKNVTSGGEVGARVDTVTVTRVDTVNVSNTIHDTVTVTRVDSVQLQPPLRTIRYPEGLYFGLGGGIGSPQGSMYTPNATGIAGQAQLGLQSFTFPLGLRVDVNYLRSGQDSRYSGLADNGAVWNYNGDLTVNLPTHMFGLSPRFTIYGLIGPSYSQWRDMFIQSVPSAAGVGPANATYSHDWQRKWGWNGGGGASLSFGRTNIFAETRVISFSVPQGTSAARQTGLVVGFNLFTGAVSQLVR